jgi:hypothetical protein
MGLSPVHMNRTLQKLRAAGLIEFKSKTLSILNHDALKEFAGFNPNYLHLTQRASASNSDIA